MKKEEKNKDETENADMSFEMLKRCKNDIAQFGFSGDDYVKFLISVKAMKDRNTVVKYPNIDLAAYRDDYIKKNEYSIWDSFQLDKFKIKSSDSNGKTYQTGYFCPRSFWDAVLTRPT